MTESANGSVAVNSPDSASSLDDPRVVRAVQEYLARAEAGDKPSRSEFVARHPEIAEPLERCLAGLEFVQAAAPHLSHPLDGVVPTDGAGAITGTLGDFRILREVGRGGMGVVYEAEQISLGRRVALKVLPFAATMDPRHLQRFHNEARAAASLHHPNIVPVYAVGEERAVHFYAMQFIAGQTLAAMIADLRQRGGKAPVPDAQPTTPHVPGVPAADTAERAAASTERMGLDRAYFRHVAAWGIQAAEAPDHAHQLGIVHRDVKPANLLVDGQGNLWVTDFGLAQVQSDTRVTMTGDLVGTLRYMSPEQALAKRVVIDHRTDVYSLGVTLYELLTLEPAFSGADRQELLRQVAFEEPKRPRELSRRVPAELEVIVLKAMEKNPTERYATAGDLADDLRRWLDGQVIRARRPTLAQQAQKWLRRHPAVVRSAMLIIVLTALGCAMSAGLLWQEEGRTREQQLRAETAAQEERKAKDAAEERLGQLVRANEILGSIFREVDPEAEEKGGPPLRVQLGEHLDEAARLLDEARISEPLLLAGLQNQLGTSLVALGDYEKARPLLEKARQTRETTLGPDHPDTLRSKHDLAELHKLQGDYDRAEVLLQDVLRAELERLGADNPDVLITKNNLAGVYVDQGKYGLAEALYQEVLRTWAARLGEGHRQALTAKNNLAHLYQTQKKYGPAESLYCQVVEGFTAALGPDHPNTLDSKSNLAGLYEAQGKHRQAEELCQDVLVARSAKLPPNHPDILTSKNNLAQVYLAQEKYDRAEALFEEAVRGRMSRLGPDHPSTLQSEGNLAATYEVQGKYDRAEPLRRELAEAIKQRDGADSPAYAAQLGPLGFFLLQQKKYSEAEKVLRECLAVREKTEPDTWKTCSTRALLGGALLGQKKYAEAEPLLLQGYEGMKQREDRIPPPGRARLPETVERLVQLYETTGKKDKADEWRRKLPHELLPPPE